MLILDNKSLENKTITNKRIELFDLIRGITLINMIVFHTLYDVLGYKREGLEWFTGMPGYVWQQSICWSFIFLSGICRNLGKNSLKRGLIVSGCGLTVTLVTLIFMPSERIIYGVLTFTGAAMLFVIPFEKLFNKINPYIGLSISAVLFFVTKDIQYHYLGFETLKLIRLPDFLYVNAITAAVGFKPKGFFSADYFPFMPWIFLFLAGYFFWRSFGEKLKDKKFMHFTIPPISFMGRHSLFIYMIHQPIAYALVYLVFKIINR